MRPDDVRVGTVVSRDNATLKRIRRLSRDNAGYRRFGQAWLEGEHLCQAARARGIVPALALFAESFWATQHERWRSGLARVLVVPDALFGDISALESAGGVGFVIDLPQHSSIRAGVPCVVLDRLQDAGNVGSILRSAAALGFPQVVALKGSAALWSPKALRAGMGAHFALHLVESAEPSALAGLELPIIATSSHQGAWVHAGGLPWPCAWAFGHEGQGLGAAVAQQALAWRRIAQPGGQESLNVAAAAAICLHASAAGRLR